MREILFRAKKKDDGEWIEGYLLRYSVIFEEKSYILPLHQVCVSDVEVDPDTVCQYTGLTDNGNKKWEGDIFEASDGDYVQRYVIQWNESELQWYAVCPYDSENNLPLCEFRVKEIDVIGNIFDNPDLLTTSSTDSN